MARQKNWSYNSYDENEDISVVGGYVWDTGSLAWIKQTTAGLGPGQLLIASGTVSSIGNNTVLTPTSGKALRVYYLSYNPASALTPAYRFGAAGPLFLQFNITANSVIAKDFGDFRYVQGAVDEALVLNLSAAVSTNYTVFYLEV